MVLDVPLVLVHPELIHSWKPLTIPHPPSFELRVVVLDVPLPLPLLL